MAWRLARSLETLRDQVNAKWPGRDKSNDGTIGDASHAVTNSDHNPNPEDAVCAMDITHDPGVFDAGQFSENLRNIRDPRIKYVIFNGRIFSSTQSPWIWRARNKGAGDHTEHVHISVGRGPDGQSTNPELYDDPRSWNLGAAALPPFPLNLQSGKGSWYSQHSGKYEWVDEGDEPGSAALGVPDDAQGVAFYNQSTLGKWFEVHYPNGFISIEQQTDIGPNPNTGRLIDIAACAAERAGYSPSNIPNSPNPYPTDAIIYWRQVSAPSVVAGLSPQEQAVKFRDLRGVTFIPPKPAGKPMPFNQKVEDCLLELTEVQRPVLDKYLTGLSAQSGEQFRVELIRLLGGTPPAGLALPKPDGTPAAPAPGGFSWTGAAGGLTISGIIAALMGGDVIGTPAGMGTTPTTGGTIGGIIGLLAPILGGAGAGSGILKGLGAIGPALSAFMSAFRAK